MSILSRLGGWRLDVEASEVVLTSGSDVEAVRAAGPAAAAAFGVNLESSTVTRAQAMRIPAVRRARNVVAGLVGTCPHRGLRDNPDGTVDDVTADRPLLTQPDRNATRSWLWTWVVDDLFFHGISWCLVVDRHPASEGGYPRHLRRLTPGVDVVNVDTKRGVVYVNGTQVRDADLLRFDAPDEGLLAHGGDTLGTLLDLERAVRTYAREPIPSMALGPEDGFEPPSPVPGSAAEWTGDPLEARSQVDYVLDEWESARRRRATAWLGGVKPHKLSFDAQQIGLADARSFQVAEVARLCNLDPAWLNAPSGGSITYTNRVDVRRDLVDVSLVGYLAALRERLSMPDVTPRGTRVEVVTDQLLTGSLAEQLGAWGQAVDLEAATPDEVRRDVLRRPPLTAAQRDELSARRAAAAPPTPEV